MEETKLKLIEEIPHGRRLGRHVEHDPRSRAFAFSPVRELELKTINHRRHIPILDQGNLGSCTGNAAVGAVGCSPLYARLPADHAKLDEAEAVAIYAAATAIDGIAGTYPPDDTGSSGLGVAKACKAAGLIAGYTHTFSLDEMLQALMHQPVIIGINWYSSFDNPSGTGLVAIAPGAYVRGGHEVVVDRMNVTARTVGFANSWGPMWGLQGRAHITWTTLERLLHEDGDCTALTPLAP